MRRRNNGQAETISSATSSLMTGRIPMASLIQTLAVAEHLNFRYAANVLGVTQSSVSSRVKALEETRAAFRTTASRRPAHRNRIFTRDGGRWGIGHYEKCGGAMTIRTGKGGCYHYYRLVEVSIERQRSKVRLRPVSKDREAAQRSGEATHTYPAQQHIPRLEELEREQMEQRERDRDDRDR